eukprot:8575887-Prorocentrum_lima.AAC.1
MTSSLVGSEMCIRDSFNALAKLAPGNYLSAFAMFLGRYRISSGLITYACLLYTSDAADDM